MDKQVEQAFSAALNAYGDTVNGNFRSQLTGVFNSNDDFMEKVALLDEAFDDAPELESLREVFFDLLMINFFAEDVQKLEEDYLDSKEWEAIEDETIDRGTELLNVLLYLRECQDEDIEPELEDFLKDFLLVDEDEFQDEHRIYEDMIANQILIESSMEEIARVSKALPATSEFKDLFYPVMSFFYQSDPSKQETETYLKNSSDPEFDLAVYSLLTSFNRA